MSSTSEAGHVTGTKDKDYNLIWFTEQSLSNALRLEDYIQDAERLGDSGFILGVRPCWRMLMRPRPSWPASCP